MEVNLNVPLLTAQMTDKLYKQSEWFMQKWFGLNMNSWQALNSKTFSAVKGLHPKWPPHSSLFALVSSFSVCSWDAAFKNVIVTAMKIKFTLEQKQIYTACVVIDLFVRN